MHEFILCEAIKPNWTREVECLEWSGVLFLASTDVKNPVKVR